MITAVHITPNKTIHMLGSEAFSVSALGGAGSGEAGLAVMTGVSIATREGDAIGGVLTGDGIVEVNPAISPSGSLMIICRSGH
jgi:hypothetical protein